LPTARSASGRLPAKSGDNARAALLVHKTANVLAKLPKSQQPKAKRALQEIWMAETKAEASVRRLRRGYQMKYESSRMPDQGSRCAANFLRLPRRALEALADHEPIESTFATVRHRTIRSKGCLSNRTALAMVFKLVEAAQKTCDASTATTSCQN